MGQVVLLDKVTYSRILRAVKQHHWIEYVSEHSEIRIAKVKAFCKHWGFTFSDERFRWQNEFIHRWFVAPWSQSEVMWEDILRFVDEKSGGDRRSGRTTMLALFLAVEDAIPQGWILVFKEFPDHWSTYESSRALYCRARELQQAWLKYIGMDSP